MIYHFINLTCWEDVYRDDCPSVDCYLVDSGSLALALKLFGVHVPKKPGVDFVSVIDVSEYYFLCSGQISCIPVENQETLPMFVEGFVGYNPKSQASFLTSSRIALGISSPKQNALARHLQALYPHCDFYCLGAAVSDKYINSERNTLGPHWLAMLVHSPRRGVVKISQTLGAFVDLMLSREKRRKFVDFSRRVKQCNESVF